MFYSPSSLRPPICPPSPGAASLGSSWPLSLISRPNPPHPVPPLSILVVSSSPSLLVFMDMDNSWEPFSSSPFFFLLDFLHFHTFLLTIYCIRIRTRGGIYDEIWTEPKGVPEGEARGNSRGLRPYFDVYPESSPNTDII